MNMADNDNIGRLLIGIRESKGIEQMQLYRGLCNRTLLYRIETGECSPDRILMDAFFQRLGLSTNIIGTSYSKTEYECIELRRLIMQAILGGNHDIIKELINRYKKKCEKLTEKTLHIQFIHLAYILIEIAQGSIGVERQQRDKVIKMIHKALNLTGLDLQKNKVSNCLLHDEELNLVLLLAENLYEQGNKNESIKLLFELLGYIERNVTDLEERGRLYPMIAMLLSKKLLEEGRYEELYVCSRGIKLLQENHKITYLPELLSYRLEGWHLEKNPKYHENKEYYQIAINGLEELDINKKKDLLLVSSRLAHGHIIGNQIRMLREMLQISQEELGDVIAQGSLSRIENGRKPTDNNYRKIMRKMGREGMRHYPFIKSNDYTLHMVRRNMARYIEQGDYDNAERELCLLEEGLNRSEPINHQFLLRSRALIDFEKNRISKEDLLEQLMEAINITKPKMIVETGGRAKEKPLKTDLVNLLEIWPLTQMETVIWNNIANAMSDMGDIKGKIHILSAIKENYEKNQVSLIHNAKGYVLTIYNLANGQELSDLCVEALKTCEDGIKICLLAGEGYILVGLLSIKAGCMEKLDKSKEACLKLYKQAFAIAKVLDYKVMSDFIETHCMEEFHVNLKECFD